MTTRAKEIRELGNTGYLEVDSSGNVGIGTNQPTAVLDVRSGAAGRPTFVHASGYGGLQLAGTGAGSGASLIFSNDFNNTVTPEFSILHDGSNDNLVFISGDPADVATQEKMRLSDFGLQIRSNSYNILNVQTDYDDNGTSDDGIIKITNGSSNTTKAEFRWDESEDTVQIAYGDHGRHIVIQNSGNVGISNTTPNGQHPDVKLYVKGGIDFSESTSASEGSTPAITQWSNNGTAQDLVVGTRSGTGSIYFNTGNAGAGGDWNASNNAHRMVIKSGGNIGMGTTAPGAPLDIETPGNTQDGSYYSTITVNNTGTNTWSRLRFDRNGSARWGLSLGTDDKFKISNLNLNGTGNPDDGTLVISNNNDITTSGAFLGQYGNAYGVIDSTGVGDSNVPYNSWGTPNVNVYRWVLPKAGTYLLGCNLRMRMWNVAGFMKGRLYNNTTGTVIEGGNLSGTTLGSQAHIRMLWEQQTTYGGINVNITANYMITTTADNQDIHHQMYSTNNSASSSLQSDSNGRNIHWWQRIG